MILQLLVGLLVLGTSLSQAAPLARTRADLAFQYSAQPSQAPLTTEKVWTLDPEELNPHRARWVLQRQSDLVGLEAVKHADGRFGVKALGIAAAAKTHIRGPGSWYRPLHEFPCTKQPQDWFAMEDGTKKAVEQAAMLWRDLLSDRRLNLSIQLDGISAGTADIALLLGRHLFQTWVRQLDQEWRRLREQKVRLGEWKLYLALAKEANLCEQEKRPAAPISWEKMMEPLPSSGEPQLLVRAPARRWNGLYSVRLDVLVGSQRVNGQFLLDSSAPTSIISPALLESQGIVSVFVQKQTGSPNRVSGVLFPNSGLARRAIVDQVELSGKPLPIREFLLFDTDFFDRPNHVASCCDGVLGMDFLANFVVEFSPGPPVEVKLWERANYRAPAEQFIWTELSAQLKQGNLGLNGLLSSCEARSGRNSIPGVRWNTGSDGFVQAHIPWAARARASQGWSLQCEDRLFADGISVSVPQNPPQSSGLEARDPGLDAGMEFLGTSSFVFDLPHGRLWLAKGPRERAQNRSGLNLRFTMQKGERVLRVESIAPKTPAAELSKAGLNPGMLISHLNAKPVEELDQWDTEQILGGVRGDVIEIRWETKAGVKIAPLKLR